MTNETDYTHQNWLRLLMQSTLRELFHGTIPTIPSLRGCRWWEQQQMRSWSPLQTHSRGYKGPRGQMYCVCLCVRFKISNPVSPLYVATLARLCSFIPDSFQGFFHHLAWIWILLSTNPTEQTGPPLCEVLCPGLIKRAGILEHVFFSFTA